MSTKKRIFSISAVAAGIAIGLPATAWACGGEKGAHKEARFQKADTNGDGFLTQTEVGAKRWERIRVADTNKDKKVSKAELTKAHADGKLGKRGKNTRGNS